MAVKGPEKWSDTEQAHYRCFVMRSGQTEENLDRGELENCG